MKVQSVDSEAGRDHPLIGDIANAVWQYGDALTDTTHGIRRLLAIRKVDDAQLAEGSDDLLYDLPSSALLPMYAVFSDQDVANEHSQR